MNRMAQKKTLSVKEQEELIAVLKARFEKHTRRHQGLEWVKYKQSWRRIPTDCGHSMKWKTLAVNRTS